MMKIADQPADADVAVVIVAAGSGSRFGADKTQIQLGGKPLWRWSYDLFRAHLSVCEIVLVGGAHLDAETTRVEGGATRQESVRRGLDAVSADAGIILVHDAARPFVSPEIIDAVIHGCREVGAAAPVLPVVDTLRSLDGPTLDRSRLMAMQTPQGARADLMRRAHALAAEEFTDEIAMLVAIGAPWRPVAGSPLNFKITVPEDLIRARAVLRHETRTGFGYDIHAFSTDPSRPLWLGGVLFPNEIGLEGHSDADALLHAITDALLGAGVLGDIGQHFPPSDPQWEGKSSLVFLEYAAKLLASDGWDIVHVDVTVIAERPNIMQRAAEIRARIAEVLSSGADRFSIKATTNEGLGALGRSEGIAAYAIATVERWI